MARARSVFACGQCGAQQPRRLGRCPACGAWGSLIEEAVGGGAASAARGLRVEGSLPAQRPRTLGDIPTRPVSRLETGISELDRVLGGGLVPGSVVLLGGEPGIGKSTLGLQLAAKIHERHGPVLYVTGEESPEQVRLRSERLTAGSKSIWLLAETQVEALADAWREIEPALLLVDSIQTMRTERVESAPGSVAQVRESAALLAATAKERGTVLILIGHVTKDGSLAGPRLLEHLVDVVLSFEGDARHAFRLLRSQKNRFGSTHELGVFSMGESGLSGVPNPSELFLAERRPGSPGSCIVPLLEGTRPILLEIQALVAPAGYGTARRTCLGIDESRVSLLLAVLERHANVELVSRDVYVNVTGGVRVSEPSADLGVALALVSSRLDLPLPDDVAACGEVGLGGEVRRVGRTGVRLREAARLGFRRVLLPAGLPAAETAVAGIEPVPVGGVAEAVAWLRASRPAKAPVNKG